MAGNFTRNYTSEAEYHYPLHTSQAVVAGLKALSEPNVFYQLLTQDVRLPDGQKEYMRPEREVSTLSDTNIRKPAKIKRGQTDLPRISTGEVSYETGVIREIGYEFGFDADYWDAAPEEQAIKYSRIVNRAYNWINYYINQAALNTLTENFVKVPSDINRIAADSTISNGGDILQFLSEAEEEIMDQNGYDFTPDLFIVASKTFYDIKQWALSAKDLEYTIKNDNREIVFDKMNHITIMNAGYTTDADNFIDDANNDEKMGYLISNTKGDRIMTPLRRYWSYPKLPGTDTPYAFGVPNDSIYMRTRKDNDHETITYELRTIQNFELVEPKGVCQIYDL